MMKEGGRVDVRTSSGAAYPVVVGPGVSRDVPGFAGEHAPGGGIALVSDSNVDPLHGRRVAQACREAGLEVAPAVFPAGEASKTREQWARLTDALLAAGLGRDACLVAVGGGVTTDLGGFVAATYLRGIPVIQVPTSYLAMIDASVGGKTGVDVDAGKNLVGAFHPPAAVVADTELLDTLPARERREGLVEAVKHGAILDRGHLETLHRRRVALLDADAGAASEIVLASVALKARVVSEDEREEGYRQILNFGHTIGHAIEAASAFALGHGSAVGLGMLAEAEIGEAMGVTESGTRDRLAEALDGLVAPPDSSVDLDRVLGFLGQDKKVRKGRPRYVLLRRLGEVAEGEGWTWDAPDDLVRPAVRRVLGVS